MKFTDDEMYQTNVVWWPMWESLEDHVWAQCLRPSPLHSTNSQCNSASLNTDQLHPLTNSSLLSYVKATAHIQFYLCTISKWPALQGQRTAPINSWIKCTKKSTHRQNAYTMYLCLKRLAMYQPPNTNHNHAASQQPQHTPCALFNETCCCTC